MLKGLFFDLGYPRFVTRHLFGIVLSLTVATIAATGVAAYLYHAEPLPLCTVQHIETKHRSAYTTTVLVGKVPVTTWHPAHDYEVTVCDTYSDTVTVPEKPTSDLILAALGTFAIVYTVLTVAQLMYGVLAESGNPLDVWLWIFSLLFLILWGCVAAGGLAGIAGIIDWYRTQ